MTIAPLIAAYLTLYLSTLISIAYLTERRIRQQHHARINAMRDAFLTKWNL